MAMIIPSRFPRGTQTPAVRGNAADYIPPGILSFSWTGFFMVRISKVKHRSHLSQMAWLETSFGRCCIWLDNSGYIPAEAAYTSHEEGCGMELASGKPKFTWKSLVGLLVVTLGLAGLSGFLTRDSMDVYQTLNLPSFAPPGWAFPVAWGILYPVMAIAAWLTLRSSTGNVLPILLLYGAQLLANVIWPLLFFLQRAWGLSFVWLLLVFALALVTCIRFFKSSRWGGGLMMAYLAWLAFAAVLNFSIARLNPQ